MAPIYDTDVAAERWARSEWDNFELWEKIEIRERRKRRFWILGTIVAFLLLSSLPVVLERLPKWRTIWISRRVGTEIGNIKRDASLRHQAVRVRFPSSDLRYVLETAESCQSTKWMELAQGQLVSDRRLSEYSFVNPTIAQQVDIPGLSSSFCYDPQVGADLPEGQPIGLAFAPVKDLTEGRTDRISILLVSGNSAEISFE